MAPRCVICTWRAHKDMLERVLEHSILDDGGGRRGRSGCCLLNLAGAAIAVVVGLTCLGYLSIMVAIAVVIGLAVWSLLCLCFISYHEKHK